MDTPFAPTRVFVSHCGDDFGPEGSPLRRVVSELQRAGCEVFLFQERRAYGQDFLAMIQDEVSRCDVFLLAESRASVKEEWVRRELHLAVALQKERCWEHPRIVPVSWRDGPWEPVPLLHIETGEPAGSYPLPVRDVCDLRQPEEIAKLVQEVASVWRITFLGDEPRMIERLRDGILDCYVEMFPDPAERIALDYILDAILSGHDPDGRIFAVSHCGASVAGFMSLFGEKEGRWMFGNYFCMLPAARGRGRARQLAGAVLAKCKERLPNMRGIVFEVDPMNTETIEKAWRRAHAGEDVTSDPAAWRAIRQELRNVRRLRLYTRDKLFSCLCVQDAEGRPLEYWQPAMDEKMDPSNERLLHLMVCYLPGMTPPEGDVDRERRDVHDLLGFVYDDLFSRLGYAAVEIHAGSEAWKRYVRSVKERVLKGAAKGVRLSRLALPTGADRLIENRFVRRHERDLAL